MRTETHGQETYADLPDPLDTPISSEECDAYLRAFFGGPEAMESWIAASLDGAR